MTALGGVAGKAGMTLPARGDRPNQYPVAQVIASDPFSQLDDYADWLVSNHKTRLNGVFASYDV